MIKQYLEAGKIINTHGIHGELRVEPWCDSPEFLCDFMRLYIDGTEYKVEQARIHKNTVLLKLQGVETINEAMRYKNKQLYIDRNDVELEEGAWFIQDIIGYSVVTTDGETIGKLQDVLTLPSNDVYVVSGETEHMIPAVPEFIKSVDTANGIINVSLIEGM